MSISINVGAKFNARDLRAAQRELEALGRQGQSASARMLRLGDSMKRVGGQMQSVGRQMSRQLTAPIVGLGVAGVKLAADFETSFGKIQGLVGVAAADIGELQNAARTLGPQFGVSAGEAAEALFFITSAGLRGSEAISTLQASLKASAIGLGDTATVADLATSAMNAFGSDVLSASGAVDVLTGAVRLGKLAPDELAGSIGQVLPLASAMGVTFNDVGAAFAAMSRTGTNAATAGTQLRQILASLQKPTADAEKALSEFGLSSAGLRQQLREKGLLSVLSTLTDTFGDNETAISRVFGNIRALSGVLDLMGPSVGATTAIFNEMGSVVGLTDEALESVTDTAAFKLKVAMQELKGSLQDVGTTLLPLVKDIADGLSRLADRFNNLSEGQQQFIIKALGITAALGPLIAIFGSLVVVIGAVTVALGAMSVAMIVATGGLVLLGAAIGLVAFNRMGRDTSDAARALEHEARAAQHAAAGNHALADAELRQAEAIRQTQDEMARRDRRREAFDNRQASEAARELAASTEDAADALQDLGTTSGQAGPKVVALTGSMRSMLQELNDIHVGAGDSGAAIAQFSREMLAAGNITDATARGAEKLAQTIRGNLDKALADGNRRLDEAKQKFTQYRDAIAGGISRGNTLSDAVDRQEDALRRAEEAQTAYTAALEAGDAVEIAKTSKALKDAKKEQSGLLGFLQVGADTAEGFADQIEALRLAGASLEVVQQVAQLGARTGGRVVAELLSGGAEAIAQANTLVSAVEAAAARAGEGAAQQFFGAGVRSARQFVKAIEATIPELQSVLDQIAEMISKALGIRLDLDISGRGTAFIDTGVVPERGGTPAFDSRVFTAEQARAIAAVPRSAFDNMVIPGLATGGLVTSPTFAMIGEAGPEVVIPLDRMGKVGGDTYVINVTGGMMDPEGVAREVVKVLNDAQRRSGSGGSNLFV
jgi:TP901 family phage tail tape measure protein